MSNINFPGWFNLLRQQGGRRRTWLKVRFHCTNVGSGRSCSTAIQREACSATYTGVNNACVALVGCKATVVDRKGRMVSGQMMACVVKDDAIEIVYGGYT